VILCNTEGFSANSSGYFIFLSRNVEQNFEGVEKKNQTNCFFEKKEQGQYLRTGNTIKYMVASDVS
jgi:hypothetical protein